MTRLGPLDLYERWVRFALGVSLLLLFWGFGWTSVEAVGALVLGGAALVTALAGYDPLDRALARIDTSAKGEPR